MSLLLETLQNSHSQQGASNRTPTPEEQVEKLQQFHQETRKKSKFWKITLFSLLALTLLISAAWVAYFTWAPTFLPSLASISPSTDNTETTISSNPDHTGRDASETAVPQEASKPLTALPLSANNQERDQDRKEVFTTQQQSGNGPQPTLKKDTQQNPNQNLLSLPEKEPQQILPELPPDSRIVIRRHHDQMANATPSISSRRPQVQNTSPEPATLQRAYQAWQEGKWSEAAEIYKALFAIAPENPDVLLGNIYVSLRESHVEETISLLRRLLNLEPLHPDGVALLATLTNGTDPLANESRLRQAIHENPSHPSPYHALGKLLAAQQRWAEAQNLFFQAMILSPTNAALRYDLAVSLDHLGQYRAALSHYKEALRLSQNEHPHAFALPFSQQQVRERIFLLEGFSEEQIQ